MVRSADLSRSVAVGFSGVFLGVVMSEVIPHHGPDVKLAVCVRPWTPHDRWLWVRWYILRFPLLARALLSGRWLWLGNELSIASELPGAVGLWLAALWGELAGAWRSEWARSAIG